MRRFFSFVLGLFLTWYFGFPAWANDQIPGRPQSQPIVIRDATLHRVDQPTIRQGSLLFADGRIMAIGRKVDIPPDAKVIDGKGRHVYPGLIESMSDLGLREVSAVQVSVDRSERGRINPNVRSWVAVNPDSELIPVTRAGGVLLAHIAPGGGFLRGQSAVMQLDGWTAKEMVLSAPAGQCVSWDSLAPIRIAPSAKAKDVAESKKKRQQALDDFEELIARAKRYAARKQDRRAAQPVDLRLESLLTVINRQHPLFVEANRQATIESAVAFAVEHDFRIVIYGGYDADRCAELLRRHDVSVIVSGIYRLPLRRDDAYDAAFTLPLRLQQAGVAFAIAGEGAGYPGGASNARNLPYHAACAVAYGLDREQAIRSITLSAAEILGVDSQVGSLTKGKDATLIITDGDILETENQVADAYIRGRQVDLTSKHTMLYEKYRQKYQQAR